MPCTATASPATTRHGKPSDTSISAIRSSGPTSRRIGEGTSRRAVGTRARPGPPRVHAKVGLPFSLCCTAGLSPGDDEIHQLLAAEEPLPVVVPLPLRDDQL